MNTWENIWEKHVGIYNSYLNFHSLHGYLGTSKKILRFSPNAGALRNTKMSTRRLVDPGQHTLYLGRAGGYMGIPPNAWFLEENPMVYGWFIAGKLDSNG
jgi:hypothetical protein